MRGYEGREDGLERRERGGREGEVSEGAKRKVEGEMRRK